MCSTLSLLATGGYHLPISTPPYLMTALNFSADQHADSGTQCRIGGPSDNMPCRVRSADESVKGVLTGGLWPVCLALGARWAVSCLLDPATRRPACWTWRVDLENKDM